LFELISIMLEKEWRAL